MSDILQRIEIINGEFRAHWNITNDAGTVIGSRMVQRKQFAMGEESLADWLALGPQFADAIKTKVDEDAANASAAAEAARLAELERWNSLTPEEQAAEIAANTPPPPVPEQITPRQLRLWLVNRGISLAAVESALPNEAARIEWEYANYFDRANPLVAQMALLLGLDADQVFREAALL